MNFPLANLTFDSQDSREVAQSCLAPLFLFSLEVGPSTVVCDTAGGRGALKKVGWYSSRKAKIGKTRMLGTLIKNAARPRFFVRHPWKGGKERRMGSCQSPY